MERARLILDRVLHPPKWVLAVVPPLSFASLLLISSVQNAQNAPAYFIYGMSAYSLAILIAALPGLTKRARSAMMNSRLLRKAAASPVARRYCKDLAFRGSVGIYQGMAVNFFYVVFRIAAGIRYASVWFISMAVYYLVLGCLRAYLVIGYRHRSPAQECHVYRRTAWLLFLLNIPMGGMIVLMVRTNSGFSYPGYIIYLSALYTFYTMVTSVRNLVRFRKLGSPILSAAKVLNFISSMMSILALQTAMISRFSDQGENYRRTMNAVTGGFVYGTVILIAVYMLLHGRTLRKKVETVEPVRE